MASCDASGLQERLQRWTECKMWSRTLIMFNIWLTSVRCLPYWRVGSLRSLNRFVFGAITVNWTTLDLLHEVLVFHWVREPDTGFIFNECTWISV